ncbi:MAG: ParB/RepB/Spo0J family partition protein [Nitrospirae bacterium]|nr:ParB/RepB/Spo0J family partition protein [Nitrospirota bacterium]
MQKKALGRGLDALFERPLPEGSPHAPAPGRFLDVDVQKIIPNRYQPRKVFKEPELRELAASLKGNGVLQPVIVRRVEDGRFELIAGERRWRAAKLAGLDRIPAVLRDASDPEAVELALIENLQRENLNPIETAKAYRRLIEEFHVTQEDAAKRVGKERSSIANALRLLGLPPELQDAIASDQLSVGHAKVLLSLTGLQPQLRLARQIMRKGLSVRAAEAAVRRLASLGQKVLPKAATPVVEAQERLMRYLGTRVRITASKEGGQITVRYHNSSDLDRLLELILK